MSNDKYRPKKIINNVTLPDSLWQLLKVWMQEQGAITAAEAIRMAIRQVTQKPEQNENDKAS